MKAVVISLEPWADAWGRNQHLSVELLRQGFVSRLWFVEPPSGRGQSIRMRAVRPGVVAVTPSSPLPKTLGGLRHIGGRLRRNLIQDADLLWVNDPILGAHCLSAETPTIYDVTDDWRAADPGGRITRAEDRLAHEAQTVVGSPALRQLWQERYGLHPPVVQTSPPPVSWAQGADEFWKAAMHLTSEFWSSTRAPKKEPSRG
jgi:hypothetical protein